MARELNSQTHEGPLSVLAKCTYLSAEKKSTRKQTTSKESYLQSRKGARKSETPCTHCLWGKCTSNVQQRKINQLLVEGGIGKAHMPPNLEANTEVYKKSWIG